MSLFDRSRDGENPNSPEDDISVDELMDFRDRPTFLSLHEYSDANDLLSSINEKVIKPAEAKAEEIRRRRAS